MNVVIIIHFILTVIIIGCDIVRNGDEVELFIPGTYIRFSQHEYGKEYDTLLITLQNREAKEYKILRKWKYERVLDGKPSEPEYKKQVTTGVYHSADKVIKESETGSLYSFSLGEKVLYNGEIKYKKL